MDDRLVRVLLGELADLLHRLRVHLALHLGDVDHGRGAVGDGDGFVAADDRDVGAAAVVMLPPPPPVTLLTLPPSHGDAGRRSRRQRRRTGGAGSAAPRRRAVRRDDAPHQRPHHQ